MHCSTLGLLRVPQIPVHEHTVPCHGCQMPAGESNCSCVPAKANMLSPAFLQFSRLFAAVGSLKMPQVPQEQNIASLWQCPLRLHATVAGKMLALGPALARCSAPMMP